MEVTNLHVVGVSAVPAKADAALSFDTDLPHVGSAEFLELVSRRNREVVDATGRVYLGEFAERGLSIGSKALRRVARFEEL